MKKIQKNMYNEQQKKEYLEYIQSNYQSQSHYDFVKNIFLNSYQLETELDKDISMFDNLELNRLFCLNQWGRKYQFSSTKSHLIAYMNWCDENGYGSSGSAYSFTRADIIKTVVKQKYPFKSIEEIKTFFYNLMKMDEQNYHESNLMKYCMCMLVWNGFSCDEVMKIKRENIDYTNNLIEFDSKIIKFNNEDIKIIKEADECRSSIMLYLGERWVRYKLSNTDYLIKRRDIDMEDVNRRYTNETAWIRKSVEKLGDYSFSFGNLFINAMFIRVKELKENLIKKYIDDYNEWLRQNF